MLGPYVWPYGRGLPPSQHRQVPLELPGRHLQAVLVPLLLLQRDVALEDVRAEDPPAEVGLRERVDRLAEGLGQADDPPLAPPPVAELEQGLLHGRRQLVALLDPLEAGVEQGRGGEGRVARRIGAADLGPRRLLLAGGGERGADQGRAGGAGPCAAERG